MYLQKYGLWNEDDSENIKSLVLEAINERKMDITELLLDAISRSALGNEFSLETVDKIIENLNPLFESRIKNLIRINSY